MKATLFLILSSFAMAGIGPGIPYVFPTNGDCLVGNGSLWVAGSCGSGGGGGGGGGITSINGDTTAAQLITGSNNISATTTGGTTTVNGTLLLPKANPTWTGTMGTPLSANNVVLTNGTGQLITGPVNANLQLSGQTQVANGGTGDASLTAYAVMTGGTTTTGVVQTVTSNGVVGQVLTSMGSTALPEWTTPVATGANAALSNLSNVAINTPLKYNAGNGSATAPLENLNSGTAGTASGLYTDSSGNTYITAEGSNGFWTDGANCLVPQAITGGANLYFGATTSAQARIGAQTNGLYGTQLQLHGQNGSENDSVLIYAGTTQCAGFGNGTTASFYLQGSFALKGKTWSTATYTASANDTAIFSTYTSGAKTLTLINNGANYNYSYAVSPQSILWVVDQAGNAGANNITIDPPSGTNPNTSSNFLINGLSSYVMNTNYQQVQIIQGTDLNFYTVAANPGNATQTTLTGSAGTAICSQPEQRGSYKKVVCYLSGYTAAAQAYNFPTAFTNTPYVYGLTAGVSGTTASTSALTFSTTLLTGFVFAEGY